MGETAYVAGVTEPLQHGPVAVAKGIVGHADLRLGERVREVLEAHLEAGRGRFRGVRHLTTWDTDPTLANPLSAVPRGLLLDPAYRAGVAQLAPLGLSYDAWLFFPQLPELFELAKANPDTRVIVNHCGGVVRIASYADKRPEVFERWSASMRTLAQLPNVYVKVGGRDAHQRLRFREGRTAAVFRATRRHVEAVDDDLHRRVRPRALHVREQFPGRQGRIRS